MILFLTLLSLSSLCSTARQSPLALFKLVLSSGPAQRLLYATGQQKAKSRYPAIARKRSISQDVWRVSACMTRWTVVHRPYDTVAARIKCSNVPVPSSPRSHAPYSIFLYSLSMFSPHFPLALPSLSLLCCCRTSHMHEKISHTQQPTPPKRPARHAISPLTVLSLVQTGL
jgi:hypothetical protein